MRLFETITNLDSAADLVRRRRFGVIEMIDGRFDAIHFRPLPKIVSLVDVMWLGPRHHNRKPGNRCLVYYNQPWRFPNFLALTYVLSTRDCTLASFHGGLEVLDEVARLKRSDAILCDAWNSRISDRLLARWGWQPHTASRWHRNYIKRFYGAYEVNARVLPGDYVSRVGVPPIGGESPFLPANLDTAKPPKGGTPAQTAGCT